MLPPDGLEKCLENNVTVPNVLLSESYLFTKSSSSNLSCVDEDVNPEIDSNSPSTYVAGTFEGPEKTIEVCFRPGVGHADGLRALTREQLDHLCKKAKCEIVSSIAGNHMDAYVLSESSLFIYKHKYIMKTCGTTTLLRCLGDLLVFADELGLELTWVGYSRKNLFFPGAQQWPHSSFGHEIEFLGSHDKLQERLRGSAYILGPVTGDHWYVYVADHTEVPMSLSAPVPSEITINLMMFDMAPEVSENFFRAKCPTARDMTTVSGIAELVPGATIDDMAFTPCGYSMNAILHDSYSTIHVTPEKECSYASFETNGLLRNYLPLIRNALNVFRPKRFVCTMFGDENAIKNVETPFNHSSISVGNASKNQYTRTSMSSTKVEFDFCCLMACFSLDNKTGAFSVESEQLLEALSKKTKDLKGMDKKPRGYSLC